MECSLGLDSRDSSWLVDILDVGTASVKLSLKLYDESELQVGYQQSITEAPAVELTLRGSPGRT